jgi:hypothetical protein
LLSFLDANLVEREEKVVVGGEKDSGVYKREA